MEPLARAFIFLEMLLVNLITSHLCSRKKHSLGRIISELIFFTVLILLVSFIVKSNLNLIYLDYSAIIFLGFTYFFPLKHLYNESSKKTLTIMFFSWMHTMTVNWFALQISNLLTFKYYFQVALVLQTIIYLFTTPIIVKYVKNKFLYILKNITREMDKLLVTLSLFQFTTLIIIYLYFIEEQNPIWKTFAVILIVSITTLSYHLIYVIVKNYKSISFFKRLAYTDDLTGIKNRLSLFLDCE